MSINRDLLIAFCATFVAFCTLYTPQPMLPLLAQQFMISSSDAGLLMTATLLPLGLAPVFYGYFLQAIPARLMLAVALGLLMLDQLAFYLASEFWHLIVLRGVQGLLLSAIFTALMTYCASMAVSGRVRRTMGFYIAATVLGGFVGRAIGGFFASHFVWNFAYVVLGVLLILPLALLYFARSDAEISFQRLDANSIVRVLKDRNYRYIYLALTSVFFVYAGLLNLMPFRFYEIDPTVTPLFISSLYFGYLIGIPVAIYSERLSKRMNDERKSLLLGLTLSLIGLSAFYSSYFLILFVLMFCFAGGFFFIHTTLSGLVNHLATEHKGVVNGLYVSIYYISGALASWIPGFVYDGFGWNAIMLVFVILLLFSGWFLSRLTIPGS